MLNEKMIDKSVPIPLYFQLKTILLKEIEKGTYPVNSMIPTENELGEIFGLSRTTVRQAILELVQEGKLYRVKSKGTFVAKPKIQQNVFHRFASYNELIRKSGGEPSVEVPLLEVCEMPEELRALREDPPKTRAIRLVRIHKADGEPIVHTTTYLPFDHYEFVFEHDFTQERLYRVLAPYPDLRIENLSRDIDAVTANSEDARILGVTRGKPIHCFTTVGYNRHMEAVEYSVARYRGDRSKFHLDVSIASEYSEDPQ